jgi:hypothetical protein
MVRQQVGFLDAVRRRVRGFERRAAQRGQFAATAAGESDGLNPETLGRAGGVENVGRVAAGAQQPDQVAGLQ